MTVWLYTVSQPNLIFLSEYLNKGMDSCRLEVKNPAFGIGLLSFFNI
jgi:hypothetical protein